MIPSHEWTQEIPNGRIQRYPHGCPVAGFQCYPHDQPHS